MAALTLVERLDRLAQAVVAGRGVLSDDVVGRASRVEDRAGHRLRLSADHTVVALAGATGSGKSSLLNALAGEPVAEVDVLRPTTAEALALVSGPDGAGPLLDWLGVRRRVVQPPQDAAPGLVLLDLPDHDSVVVDHRWEAERLVELVDLLVWVVDPQKYADAALHERYLRPLRSHGDVMLVVLNQVDRLTRADASAAATDLRRLLVQDGLPGVPVLALSALTGEGVPALREALDAAARRRAAAQARLGADVADLAQEVLDACDGRGPGRRPRGAGRPPAGPEDALVNAFSDAAGVPRVIEAVRVSSVLAARRATGWPPTRWVGRLRADPLRALHLPSLGAPGGGRSPGGTGPQDDDAAARAADTARTSLPTPGAAQVAAAAGAVRRYVDAALADAPDAWVLAAREQVEGTDPAELARLADALDRAVAGAPILARRRPRWWTAVGALQWFSLVVLVGGLGWLGVLAGLDAALLPSPEPPQWREVPLPTLAVAVGLVLGLVLAVGSHAVARVAARRHARRATVALRAAVAAVARDRVVEPVGTVLGRLAACREAAAAALGTSRGRASSRGA